MRLWSKDMSSLSGWRPLPHRSECALDPAHAPTQSCANFRCLRLQAQRTTRDDEELKTHWFDVFKFVSFPLSLWAPFHMSQWSRQLFGRTVLLPAHLHVRHSASASERMPLILLHTHTHKSSSYEYYSTLLAFLTCMQMIPNPSTVLSAGFPFAWLCDLYWHTEWYTHFSCLH